MSELFINDDGVDEKLRSEWQSTGNFVEDCVNLRKTIECPICMDILSDPAMLTECGHIFCKECIHKSFEIAHKCPMCSIPNNRRQIQTIPSKFHD